jgi:hypothetical protein
MPSRARSPAASHTRWSSRASTSSPSRR